MDEQAKLAILRDWVKAKKLRQNVMAETLSVTPTTISNLLSGKTTFTKPAAEKWAKTYGLNPSFLLYGEGEVEIEDFVIRDYIKRHNAHEVALAGIKAILELNKSGDSGWEFIAADHGIGLIGISTLADFRRRFETWYTAGCPYV